MRVGVEKFGDAWRRVSRLRQDSVDVPLRDLRKLLAGSRGEVIVVRRLTRAEVEVLERERGDSGAGVHARIVVKEEERFQRPRRGDTSKR